MRKAESLLGSNLLPSCLSHFLPSIIRILAIVAGTNAPSNSDYLADRFLEGCRRLPEMETEKIRLKDVRLEHFTLAFYDERTDQGPEFERLRALILRADGILIVSPIWNFSVPAELKNLIDRIGAFTLDRETRSRGQLQSKPFFFLFTGGAPVPAWKGLMRLTTSHVSEAIRYMGGTIVGKAFEGKCMPGRGIFGCVVDRRPEALERMRRKGDAFARFALRFKETGQLPLYHRAFARMYRWGQRIIAKL